jgi:hypothetical protein
VSVASGVHVLLRRDIERGELRDYVVQPGVALSKLVSQLGTSAEHLATRNGKSVAILFTVAKRSTAERLGKVCKPYYRTLVACNGA